MLGLLLTRKVPVSAHKNLLNLMPIERKTMNKPQLTENEYIAELNRQLEKHEYYEEGMEFVASPEGAIGKGMTGYSVKGPHSKIGVFAQVAHKVSERYDLKV